MNITEGNIDKLIDLLSNVNSKSQTVLEWKAILSSQLSGIFSTKTYSIDFDYLYRARPNEVSAANAKDLFRNTKELWAPPRRCVKKLGRCNQKGQSLLYCTTDITTAMVENRLKPKTGFSVIEYKTKGRISPLSAIGIQDLMKISDFYKKLFLEHYKDHPVDSIEADKLLSSAFKMRGSDEELSNVYSLTNAITQIFLNNQKNVDQLPGEIAPRSIGLLYPSVETKSPLGLNIVFVQQLVKEFLTPKNVYKYDVLEIHENHFFTIKLTHQTERIRSNGDLVWKKVYDSKIEQITDYELKNYTP